MADTVSAKAKRLRHLASDPALDDEAPRPQGVNRGRLQMQPYTDRRGTKHQTPRSKKVPPPTPVAQGPHLENF